MQRLPFEKGMVNSPVMIKPKGIRLRNESHEHLDDDEDEDIDLRSGFPAHKNVLGGLKAKTGKPQIKFNLKNMSLSQNKGPQSESNEKYIDKHEDSDGRNQNIPAETLTTDKLSKNENKQSELYDPFDLSDVDERESVEMDLDSDMDKSDNEVVKVSVELDYGDVDLRSNDRSSNENSQQEHVGDYDFRKSQSRSLSPPGRESSSERKKRQTKFIDPFGLDEEFHPAHLAENISDSRLWDDTLKDNRSQTGFNKSGSSVKKVVQELSASQDSNSSEGPDGPQQDSWNQQKEKPGLAIPGFGGFDEPVMDNIPQSAKEFSHGKFGKNASEDSKNASGFGPVSKDSFWNSEHRWGRNKTDTDDRNRGNVEKHEVAKTSKGVSEKLKGVEKEEVKLDMKSVFDAEARKIKPGKVSSLTAEKKIDQGNYSTPKSKNQYDDDDFDDDISTPLPDISYQSALLESMEQSALKLRGDDDETPYKDYRTLEKTPYGKIATDSETDRKSRKRILESSLESFTIPVSKQSKLESVEDFITLDDSDKDIDDDSDDDDEGLMIASDVEEEDEGLVIDLCPTTPTTKSSSKKKIPDEEETSVDDNQEDPRAETPTIIDDEPTETIGAELESDPNHMEIASSSNEMRSAIEKSRKNMVIKFKGDTKKVNPKTGKTYSENIGSSIEVVGQSSRVKKDTSSPQSINNQNLTSTSQSSILHLPLSTASLQHQSDFPVGKFKPIGSTEPKITKPSTPETESSPVNMFAPIEEMQDKVSPPVSQVPYRMLPPLPSTVIPVNQLAQSLSGQPLKFDTGSSILPPLLPFPVQRQLFHPHSGGPHHLPGHGYGPAESSQASASSSLDRSSKDPYEWFKDKVDPSPGPKSLDAKDPANWFADKIGKKETKCEEDFRSKSKDYSDSEMKAKRQKKRKKKDKESPRKSSRKIKSEHDHSPSPKKIKYEMDGRNKSESPKKLEKKRHSEIKLERESPSYFEKRGQSQRQEESDSKNLITADEINQDNIIRDVSNLKSDVDGQTLKTSGEGKKCVNEFGNKILESLSEVKKVKKTTNDKPQSTESPKNIHEMKTASTPEKIRNKVAKPLPVKIDLSIKEKKDIQSPVKTTEKMKKDDGLIVIESDESELEDGEISDDSDDGVEEIVNDRKDTRTVVEHYSRSASERLGPYHRDQSDYLDTPKRNVNFRNDYDVRQGRRYTSKGEKGAQYWSDIISNPDTREERVKATRIESPSLRKLEPTVHKDTELLKSVASFTKAKQKVQAVCQAKTLEEWLKVELETDSVEHLKDIVPYPLHTDLTTFPKARRRKVKLKVKQTIEQEAKKRGQTAPFASSSQQASSTLQSDQQSHIEVEETYKNESYQNIPSYTRNQQNFQHGQFGQRFNQQGGYQQRNDPPWNQKRQYQNRGQGGRGNNITVGERGNNVNISERGNNLNIGGRGNNINISCNQPGQRNAPAHQPEVVVINDELDQVTPEKQPQTDPNFIKISYSPEVHNDQLERELALVKRTLLEINNRVPKSGPNFTSLNESESFPYRMKVLEDKRKVVALNMVEGEIRTLLNKTSFYGYPHRRVPEELLLNSERNTFKSLEEDVFLILMMPISVKPYMKLLQMKLNIEEKLHLKENAQTPTEVKEINDQLNSMHSQRQSLLRSFTGYLNKKRIQKIQDTVDKYTLVYEHFKGLMPPTPDSMLKHVRTTQMDLRQHLILAKQYMAMDELHHNPPAV
ncbi:hypothetical protein MAR_028844 [Mya arenaria]|uniref:Uncharacterized protein n=1 Tax=Mya arenaria TaxID=6604 RepID=A0ABY7DI49_MYAAR|nr:hypothetical protein MAR_028844 [Mya arenaria]